MKLRLFVLLSAIYLALASREQPWGDAHVVYETSARLVEARRLDVALGGPTQFYAIRDGKKYGVFPLGNVVAMAPSYVVYKLLAKIPHAPAELLFHYCCHLSTSLLIAGVCVLFFTLCRREGATERIAMWLTLLLGTGTILFVYARVPFSEALQTIALTWAVERGLALGERLTPRGALFGGIALGLLFNTKLIYAFVVLVVGVYVIVRHRHDLRNLVVSLAAAMVPLVLFVALALWHNWLKTGSLGDSGYAIPEGVFSGNVYAGLWGFLFSTGKSIFLYSAPILLGFIAWPAYLERARPKALFLAAVFLAVLLVNAKFRYWHADYCWGPRLLVPLTPTFLLPAAPGIEGALRRGRARLRALAVGALVGAGLYAQLLGASFYWDHYIRIAIAVKDQTGASGWYGEDLHHCHFIPQFSPLVGHAWLLGHSVRNDPDLADDAPWRRVVKDKVNLSDNWNGLRGDWWGADWFAKSAPTSVHVLGAAWLAFLAAIVAGCALGLRRREEEPVLAPAAPQHEPPAAVTVEDDGIEGDVDVSTGGRTPG